MNFLTVFDFTQFWLDGRPGNEYFWISQKNSGHLTPMTLLGVHPQWFETNWNRYKRFLLLWWKQQFLQTKTKMEIKNPDFIFEGILLWTVAFFSLAFIGHWTWNILCILIDLDWNWKKLYLEILFSYRLYKFLFWIKKKLLGKHPKSI